MLFCKGTSLPLYNFDIMGYQDSLHPMVAYTY